MEKPTVPVLDADEVPDRFLQILANIDYWLYPDLRKRLGCIFVVNHCDTSRCVLLVKSLTSSSDNPAHSITSPGRVAERPKKVLIPFTESSQSGPCFSEV